MLCKQKEVQRRLELHREDMEESRADLGYLRSLLEALSLKDDLCKEHTEVLNRRREKALEESSLKVRIRFLGRGDNKAQLECSLSECRAAVNTVQRDLARVQGRLRAMLLVLPELQLEYGDLAPTAGTATQSIVQYAQVRSLFHVSDAPVFPIAPTPTTLSLCLCVCV